MNATKEITESDVRGWTGDASFARGRIYYERGQIIDARREGDTLRAKCLGQSEPFYRVDAALGPNGILSANCTCPVGYEGRCKHGAALLLAWIHNPASFREVEPVEQALAHRDKTQLISLIRQMLERDPDLEDLLELPVIGEAAAQPVDPEVIQRQAAAAFDSAYGREGLYGVFARLKSLADLGSGYAQQGERTSALAVFRTLLDEMLNHYMSIPDEEGDLAAIIERSGEQLADLLRSETEPLTREGILRSLFRIYQTDLQMGGIGMGDRSHDVLLEDTSPEERAAVACWVRDAVEALRGREYVDWARQSYGGLLLELEGDQLDDATYLRYCRDTGRWQDMIERLLARDRVEEAVDTARSLSDYALVSAATMFERHGQIERLEQLARERASGDRTGHLLPWLAQRAADRGDVAELLSLNEQMMRQWPSLERYRELAAAARVAGQWDRIRAETLARLAAGNQDALLTDIYLYEEDVEAALDAFARLAQKAEWQPEGLAERLAQAAEAGFPGEAARIYLDLAERRIANRNRGAYQEAAGYLAQLRDLLRRNGEDRRWQTLITDLRGRYSRLKALQDELRQAHL